MRLDAELVELAGQLPSFDFSDVATARAAFAALAVPPENTDPMGVRDDVATAPAGLPVRVRIYEGRNGAARPCLVYLHGGGFVLGGLDSEDAMTRSLARDVGCVVVSVDYRLAPEHPYPAALDDVTTVLAWLRTAAPELGVDRSRIALAGESAGACLAAASALRDREADELPLSFLYLGIPALDDRLDTASMRELADAPGWTRENAAWSWRHYLGDHVPDDSGHAAPARARSLRGLPPTFVAVSELDPLRDEGLDFARRLLAEEVSTEISLYRGTFHGSSLIAPDTQVSRRMHRDKTDALRRGMDVDRREELLMGARR